jgi:metal-responsive CopG/Arc/MetJ family transcriptional regulator
MPNKQNSQSNVRWGELYPALSALAESEGRPRSEIAREALRAYLKKKRVKAPPRPKLAGADG